MQMSATDIKKYPKFACYVSVSIPRDIIPNNFILEKIKKFSGDISTAKIKEALTWGKGPMIKITDLPEGTLGEFTPDSNSNEIRVDVDVVKEFEKGKGLRKTPRGRMVYLAGVTLLHELTHWADDQDGVDTAGEEGELFEKEVYGGVID
jgi:hypothetical protein